MEEDGISFYASRHIAGSGMKRLSYLFFTVYEEKNETTDTEYGKDILKFFSHIRNTVLLFGEAYDTAPNAKFTKLPIRVNMLFALRPDGGLWKKISERIRTKYPTMIEEKKIKFYFRETLFAASRPTKYHQIFIQSLCDEAF